jgi:hypothetical protein
MDKTGSKRVASPKIAADVLGVLGAAMGLLGGCDLILVFVPASWGNPEWEFGTLVAVMDSLPIIVLGLALVVHALAVREKLSVARVVGWLAMGLAVGFLVGGVWVLARTLGPALASPTDPLIRLGVKKAIAKVVVQVVVAPIAMGLVGWMAVKKSTNAANAA